jgi:hypothetical protein
MSSELRTRAPWTVPIAEGPIAVWADRALAGSVVAAAAACVWGLASIAPDARGHGTHEQFGWTPCSWPIVYGIPCPTCGCTTAACLFVHGRVFTAFATQPFGASVAAFGALVGVHALLCLLRGRSFADALVRWPFWRIVLGAFVLFVLAWGYTWLTWRP